MQSNVIFDLKKKYGNLYSVNVKNFEVIFRELTFTEYDLILYLQELEEYSYADIEDFILDYAIVYPENFDLGKIPAGLVTSLAQNVLELSGFFSVKVAKKILQDKRNEMTDVRNLMKAFVISTMPSFIPEELDVMTFSQLAEHVALAEKIIELKQNTYELQSNGLKLELIDPEEEYEKQENIKKVHDKAKPEGAATIDDPIAQKLWGLQT
jgi:hypothetical protein